MQVKVMALTAIAVMSNTTMAQDLVVKIGHVAPISGPQAHQGKDNENGARMAIEELNVRGLTIGGKHVRFELVAEDDAADPKQATSIAQKLCDAKVAGVVGHLNSGTTIPASKIYNECGIPHITPSATNPSLTKQGYKTTFRLVANDNALGAGLASYASDKLKLKNVAVIDDRTAYGQGVAEIFQKTAQDKGMKIVGEQYTTDKATDFTAILTSIKAMSPDAIFYGGMDPQAGLMLRQMEQLGMEKLKLIGGDGICSTELAKLAGGAKTLDNVVCPEAGASLEKMPGGQAWKERYDRKFPGQYQIYSPYTYDAVMVLVDGMVRAKSADPAIYTSQLAKADFKGVITNVQFEPNGDLKNAPLTMFRYVNGKKVALD